MHPGCLWTFKHDHFIKAHEAAYKRFKFRPSNFTAESSKVLSLTRFAHQIANHLTCLKQQHWAITELFLPCIDDSISFSPECRSALTNTVLGNFGRQVLRWFESDYHLKGKQLCKYNGTPFIRSLTGHKSLAVLTGWPY